MEAPEMEKNKTQGALGSLWHVRHPKHRSSGKGGRREPEGCSGKEAPRRGLAGDAGCAGMRGDRDAVAERAVSL